MQGRRSRVSDRRSSLQSFSEAFSAEEVVKWAATQFGDGMVLQTSAGIQAAVMIKLVTSIKPDVKVVFVDTGYLPKETTDYMATLHKEFNLNLTIARPLLTPEQIESQHGKLWETDHELYGEITKVEPMNRALTDLSCTTILSGLRGEQTSNRGELQKLSYDMGSQRFKVLPILAWTKAEVKLYMTEMMLPRHPLESAGFATVGDAHSSRAVKATDKDERSTRFGGKSQECGLHSRTVSIADLIGQMEEAKPLPPGYVVFTKPSCKFCKAAKVLLSNQGIHYLEKDITDDAIASEMYSHAPDAQTVPQIFLDNVHIGGFSELHSEFDIDGSVDDYVSRWNPEAKEKTSSPKKEPSMWKVLAKKAAKTLDLDEAQTAKYSVAVVVGGAALLNVVGVALLGRSPNMESGSKLLESSSRLLDSSAKLLSDSRLLDRLL